MRLPGLTLAVLAFSCGLPAGRLIAATPPKADTTAAAVTPPAVRSEPALSSADIQQLRDAIEGLRQRYEGQGEILKKINENLDSLGARLDPSKRPADLASLREGIGTLVGRVNESHAAVVQLRDALTRTSADNATATSALSAGVARLQEQITALDSDLARLHQDAAARNAVAPAAPAGVGLGALVAVVAAGTLLLGAAVAFFGLRSRAVPPTVSTAVVASLEQEIRQLREGFAAQKSARPAPPPDTRPLTDAVARLESLVERLETPAPSPSEAPTLPQAEYSAAPRPASVESAVALPGLWPSPFLDAASPLARWRDALEADLASAEHPSLPVVASLLALRLVAGRPAAPVDEVAEAVANLSEALHHYWQNLPDLTEDGRIQAGGDWIDGVRLMIARVAPQLSIEQIVPGPRIDSNTMQTVQQGTGNHLNVAEVFSWTIRDLSGERPRILHRARIATT
jgi:hypothetical protein